MVIETDTWSSGIWSNKIFMSSTESIATPALPTSPVTRGWGRALTHGGGPAQPHHTHPPTPPLPPPPPHASRYIRSPAGGGAPPGLGHFPRGGGVVAAIATHRGYDSDHP